jgi:tRNA-specific 2-thiouridylase
MYVTSIDSASNTVVVGPDTALWRRELTVREINWMGTAPAGGAAAGPMRLAVKIRYRNPEAPARVVPLDGGRVRVTFDEPQRAIAPGQWAVCYDGDRIALGGVIEA